MCSIRPYYLPSAIPVLLLFAVVAGADGPPEKIVPKRSDAGDGQKLSRPAPPKAEQQAADERNAQYAELERMRVKAIADLARSEVATEELWKNMDPRQRNLMDPEITSSQYEVVEACLKDHPVELLDVVDKAMRDDAVRLMELAAIESQWDAVAKPKAEARVKSLIVQLQKAPHPVSGPGDGANARQTTAPFQGGSIEEAISEGKLSDVPWRVARLRAELIAVTVRGESVTAAEGAKLEKLFGLESGTFAKIQEDLQREARATKVEEIERYLQSHAADLWKHVARAYHDDKLTVLEYEVVKVVKEQTEIRASKARLKAQIVELWRIHKRSGDGR